jgi:hypothetical protein
MTHSSLAGIITACATGITALGGLFVALSVLLPTLRQVRQVHTMVNQQRTEMMQLLQVQRQALQAAGIDIPEDEALK